jgi:hypothetical protein
MSNENIRPTSATVTAYSSCFSSNGSDATVLDLDLKLLMEKFVGFMKFGWDW